MQLKRKQHLLLEQLEERVFLDANPLAAMAVEPDVMLLDQETLPDPQPATSPNTVETREEKESTATSEGDAGSPSEPDVLMETEASQTGTQAGDEPQQIAPSSMVEPQAEQESTPGTENDQGFSPKPDAMMETEPSQEPGEQMMDGVPTITGSEDCVGCSDAEEGTDTTELLPTVTDEEDGVMGAQDEISTGGMDDDTAGEVIDPMIGEEFTFTVNLENTSDDTLYGPYIDLYFQSAGDDGFASNSDPALAGQGLGDGLIFDRADYLGTSVISQTLVWNGTDTLLHPYAVDETGEPVSIDTTGWEAGDSLVVLEMPFGSFTPGQPPAEVVVTAHFDQFMYVDSTGGAAYDRSVQVSNGFRFGLDPLNNPATDPSVTGQNSTTLTFRPEVIRFEKVYIGPESETATGPNYPRTYEIRVEVAAGQTVNDLQVIDRLPDSIFYLGNVTGGSLATPLAPGIYSNQDLVINLGNVEGIAGIDRVVSFEFYVPFLDASGVPIIERDDGDDNDDRPIINDAQVTGFWIPLDPDDTPVTVTMDAEVFANGTISSTPDNDEEFEAKAIAIQKGVDIFEDTGVQDRYNPGDIVEYTLSFQISDYFNFGDIVVTDILPDGLDFLTGGDYAPTYTVSDAFDSFSGTWDPGVNLTQTLLVANDDLQLTFNVSEVAGYGDNGILRGSLSNQNDNSTAGLGGSTTGTITYYALIKQEYISEVGGFVDDDRFIDQGDIFNNAVTITGSIYTGDPHVPDNLTEGDLERDGSAAAFEIATGSVGKSIFAINGENPDDYRRDGQIHLQPGDAVTYRLTYELPTSDFELFRLEDYLPLPVLDVSTVASWIFELPDERTQAANFSTAPLSGFARLMSSDTFTEYTGIGLIPTISVDSGANSLWFEYGNYHSATSEPTTIDLVFTVTVSDDPFADGLFLTNQVRAVEGGTPGELAADDGIVQIVLDQPVLEITKDVDITSGIDAGDRVTFTIEVANTGSAAAFDVIIKDTLPSGFEPQAENFIVTVDGTNLDAGTGFLWINGGIDGDIETTGDNFFADPGPDGIYGTGDDGNLGGIELVDLSGGALAPGAVLTITYELVAAAGIQPMQTLTNTATITNYAGAEGGPDHTFIDPSDTATVTAAPLSTAKVLLATSIDSTTNAPDEAVIGETVLYRVTVTVPEGVTPDLLLRDSLDQGLALVTIDSISFSDGLVAQNINPTPGYTENSVGNDILTLSFGRVENTNRDNNIAETITIEYTAVVLNTAGNQSTLNQDGPELNNSAQTQWQIDTNNDGILDTQRTSNTGSADPVLVIEPVLEVLKAVTIGTTTEQEQIAGDSSDQVTYTITIRHAATSETDAFDVSLADQLPIDSFSVDGFTIATVDDTSASDILTTSDFAIVGGVLQFAIGGNTANNTVDMAYDRVITVTLEGTLQADLNVGDLIGNEAEISWSSLPGTDNSDLSPYVTTGDSERDGSGGINDYSAADPANILVGTNSVVKLLVNSEITNEDDASLSSPSLSAPNDVDGINSGREAVIGEEVYYQLTISVAEGFSPDLRVIDYLDPGLSLVRIDSISFNLSDISVENTIATPVTAAEGFVLYTPNVNDRDRLEIRLGDVTNNNNDNTVAETISITYTAMVTDISGNEGNGAAPGTQLVNEVQLTWLDSDNSVVSSDPASADSVEIIEPDLSVVKEVVVGGGGTSGDAGDSVRYSITVAHSSDSEADAWGVGLNDPLPAQLADPSIDDTVTTTGGLTLAATDFEIIGGTLRFTDNGTIDLAFDQSFTVTVRGILAQEVQPGENILNTAAITWSSIDGERNAYSDFIPTAEDQERDYNAAGGATITIPEPFIDKQGGGSYTIGEPVSYDLVITVPEGTVNGLVIVDQLPEGLIYVSHTIDAEEFVGTLTLTSFSNSFGDGNDLRFEFEPVIATGTLDGSSGNSFTITISAYVANIETNYDGVSLENTASLIYTDAGGSPVTITDDPVAISIVEPWIETTKVVDQTTGVQAGDTLTYTVTLVNGGNATAYEVNFNDTLAPGTSFGALLSAQINGSSTDIGTAIPNGDGSVVTFSDEVWDLEPGQVLAVRYTVNVTSAIGIDGDHVNRVDADWSSLDNDDPNAENERIYDEDDGIDSPVDDGLNADRDIDTAVFTTPGVTIAKDDGGVTEATIGEVITYTLRIDAPRGTINELVVEDLLEQGLIFNGDARISTDGGSTFNDYAPAAPATNDGTTTVSLTWDMGDYVVDRDENILIRYTATVANVVDNYDSIDLGNTVTLTYTNVAGTQVTDSDADDLSIVEPQITTFKDVSAPSNPDVGVLPGEELAYTVRLENTGSSTAYEVTAQDELPVGVAYVSGSAVAVYRDISSGTDTDATISVDAATPGVLSFDSTTPGAWDIAPGDFILITYSIVVQGAGYAVGDYQNTVDADWSSLDGDQEGNERVYEDQEDAEGNPLYAVDGDQDEDQATFTVLSNPPSLGDFIFFDANGDGVQGLYDSTGDGIGDTLEPGIAGVTVNLYAPDLAIPGEYFLLDTIITDATGFYQFANLPLTTFSGPYRVEVDPATLPDGLIQVYENPAYDLDGGDPFLNNTSFVEVLNATANITDVDFGYRGDGSIGDYIFYDANNNGLNDDPGWGIPGTEVTLTADLDGNGTVDFTLVTTTDENGEYLFENLPYTEYQITVFPPAGITEQAYDPDGVPDNSTTINLTDNTPNLTADFGYVGGGSIGDTIWDDLNADGIQDPEETGLEGVTVILSGVDITGDGNLDTLTTTTGPDGSYLFPGLPEGDYTISIDPNSLPDRYIPSGDPDGTLDFTTTVPLPAAENRVDIDFGFTRTGSLGDTVWYDFNANGIQDGGEVGIPGVEVTLVGDIDLDGTPDILTTTTDSNGRYLFDLLPLGEYSITINPATLPAGMVATFDLDGIGTVHTAVASLAYGQDQRDADFGYTGTGSVGDTIWNDRDRDGIQDPGEPGIGGVGVSIGIDLNGDGVPDFTTSTTTDAGGQYIFDNLPAGSHIIRIDPATLPPGIRPSFDPDGVLDGTFTVRLGPGENNRDVDFGYAFPPPGQPGSSLTPPLPGPPVEPAGLVIDAFFMHRQFGEEQFPFDRWLEISYPIPPLPVSPIYTGLAEPGTTLVLTIYDSAGNQIGNQTIMADTAGNWLASFPGTLLSELPHDMAIAQQSSLYNSSSPGLFNMRTYFNPNFTSMVHSSAQLDVATIFAYLPSTLMESVHMSNLQSFDIGWDSFKSYEFNTTSINPARTGH